MVKTSPVTQTNQVLAQTAQETQVNQTLVQIMEEALRNQVLVQTIQIVGTAQVQKSQRTNTTGLT